MESGDDASRRWGSPSAEEKTESANLRDLLRVKEDDGRNGRCRLTLSDVLSVEKRPPVQPTQTLLEIIRDEAVIPDSDGKNSWRQLRKKLRLHRAGASCFPNQQRSNQIIAWNTPTELATTSVHYSPANRTPTVESSQPEISLPSNNVGSDRLGELNSNERTVSELADRRQRTIENTVSEPADRNQQTNEGTVSELGERNQQAAEEEGVETEQPERMSLMALLAEVEGQMVAGGSVYAMDEGDDEGKEKGGREGYNYNNCCVCMVRHKGAAFIPCGHTFCRPCCRELWVQRGNCPLCNAFILEILDIF